MQNTYGNERAFAMPRENSCWRRWGEIPAQCDSDLVDGFGFHETLEPPQKMEVA